MIGRSKELEDVGRVASSFPSYLGKIEATLLAGYDEVCTKLTFVPFGLEISDRRKPGKCLSLRREANKIICVFVRLICHIINILLTELGRLIRAKSKK